MGGHHQKVYSCIQQHRCRALREHSFCGTSATLANASETGHSAFFPKSCENEVITDQEETSELELIK